jgi:hypothetical protein
MASTDSSPEQLRTDLEELKAQLAPVLARDRARFAAEGRPFDLVSWAMGLPDSHKYPGGPAFVVSSQSRRAWAGPGPARAAREMKARGRTRRTRRQTRVFLGERAASAASTL